MLLPNPPKPEPVVWFWLLLWPNEKPPVPPNAMLATRFPRFDAGDEMVAEKVTVEMYERRLF